MLLSMEILDYTLSNEAEVVQGEKIESQKKQGGTIRP
jgi:hypothetical protein